MADIKVEEEKSTTTIVIETIAALLTAAFAFVAGLAWNTAIQRALEQYFGQDDLTGAFVYAIVVTVIAVIVTIYLGRVLARYRSREKKHK